jgi:phosphoglycolate phosphatase-like HAD superfamily hydrolase
MTTPAGPLQRIISRSRLLLLDFDGPVCSIFGGVTAALVADQLRHRLGEAGIVLPAEAEAGDDPLEVFRAAAVVGPDAAERAQTELTDLEGWAVATAVPTDGASDLMAAAQGSGRTVVIVSNNSGTAIARYLESHSLTRHVSAVIGRDDPDPAKMKPSPYRVSQAIRADDATPGQTVLVGDTASDITAAHRAGIAAIGYANKPGKAVGLAAADAIVTRLPDITLALRDVEPKFETSML